MTAIATVTSETDAQLLARLIKSGGKILVVGGRITEYLPERFQKHPALLFWDDDKQGILQKDVPSNVRAILWNRWISHSMAGRLNTAAQQLHALKFPMLKTREIKILLNDIVQEADSQLPEVSSADVERQVTKLIAKQEEAAQKEVEQEQEMEQTQKSGRKGWLQAFIAKHVNLNIDWTARGAIRHEGERIFAIAQKENLTTTVESVKVALSALIRSMGYQTSNSKKIRKAPRVPKVKAPKVPESVRAAKAKDDFQELDSLLSEAITALRLVQEHMPKVRKETERLRGLREKMMRMLEG